MKIESDSRSELSLKRWWKNDTGRIFLHFIFWLLIIGFANFMLLQLIIDLSNHLRDQKITDNFDLSPSTGIWDNPDTGKVVDHVMRIPPDPVIWLKQPLADFSLSLSVRPALKGTSTIVYRANEKGEYQIRLDDSRIALWKKVNNTDREIRSFPVNANQMEWHKLHIIVRGGIHWIYLDNVIRIKTYDPDNTMPGRIGLGCLGSQETYSEFDNLELRFDMMPDNPETVRQEIMGGLPVK
jgi:hypothetical protein